MLTFCNNKIYAILILLYSYTGKYNALLPSYHINIRKLAWVAGKRGQHTDFSDVLATFLTGCAKIRASQWLGRKPRDPRGWEPLPPEIDDGRLHRTEQRSVDSNL